MVTIEEIRQQVQAYLNGRLDLNSFVDWIGEYEREAVGQWSLEHPGESEIVFPRDSPEDWLCHIELMDSEMCCSGSFRTEEMFRADLKSLLAGKPMVAFALDWGKYTAWCDQRTKDINRLMKWSRPWYVKVFDWIVSRFKNVWRGERP